MSAFSQIMTIENINEIIKKHNFVFDKLEFERGLGIIDDAFFISLRCDDILLVIRVFTNLRVANYGKTMLRYHDLFVKPNWKPLKKSEYKQQKEFESSLLWEEINHLNVKSKDKPVYSIRFRKNGDLKIRIESNVNIEARDDLDLKKSNRILYEVVLLQEEKVESYRIVETKSNLIIKSCNCQLFRPKNGVGIRFLLDE